MKRSATKLSSPSLLINCTKEIERWVYFAIHFSALVCWIYGNFYNGQFYCKSARKSDKKRSPTKISWMLNSVWNYEIEWKWCTKDTYTKSSRTKPKISRIQIEIKPKRQEKKQNKLKLKQSFLQHKNEMKSYTRSTSGCWKIQNSRNVKELWTIMV